MATDSDEDQRYVVSVSSGYLRTQALCGCGYTGKKRFVYGMSVFDVLNHSHDTGHFPIGI